MSLRTRCLALVLVVIWAGPTPGAAQPDADTRPERFVHSTDPAAVVVAFSERFGAIGDADPGPRLRVFGDGRVEVHYPHYMKRAGDWRLQLTTAELRALVGGLVDRGLAEFDVARTRERKRAKRDQARAAGSLFAVSEASAIHIELQLDRYRPADTAKPEIRNLRKVIRWTELRADARRYPGISELSELAAAQTDLLAVMERPDLVRAGASTP